MEKSDLTQLFGKRDVLETSLSQLEMWGIFFAVLVAIGVIGEAYCGYKSWRDSKELHGVMQKIDVEKETISKRESEHLQLKISEANERASKADLARVQLEKQLAPRRLTGTQKAELISLLKNGVGNIGVVSTMMDPESSDLADDLDAALKAAGWNSVRIPNHFNKEYGVWVGTVIGTNLTDTGRISDALRTIGVNNDIRNFSQEDKSIPSGFEQGVLYLVVGRKHPISSQQ